MIKLHKDLESVDDNVTLWHYMSVEKFICLICSGELHFHRIDIFNDKKEGTLTTIDKGIFRYSAASANYWENERKRHYISCWIDSPHELALMWDIYGKNGVVIKSSVKSLKRSFVDDKKHTIYLSKVQYKDYDKESSQLIGNPINVLRIIFTKRKFFEQEKEIRLLYSYYDALKGQEKEGYNLACSIRAMIEEIRLSPTIKKEDAQKIRDVMTQNSLSIPIKHSEI